MTWTFWITRERPHHAECQKVRKFHFYIFFRWIYKFCGIIDNVKFALRKSKSKTHSQMTSAFRRGGEEQGRIGVGRRVLEVGGGKGMVAWSRAVNGGKISETMMTWVRVQSLTFFYWRHLLMSLSWNSQILHKRIHLKTVIFRLVTSIFKFSIMTFKLLEIPKKCHQTLHLNQITELILYFLW